MKEVQWRSFANACLKSGKIVGSAAAVSLLVAAQDGTAQHVLGAQNPVNASAYEVVQSSQFGATSNVVTPRTSKSGTTSLVPAGNGLAQLVRWEPYDFSFVAAATYSDTIVSRMTATFVGPDNVSIQVPAYFSGGNTWKVRFSPTVTGAWTYSTSSSDSGLNGKTGSFNVVSNTSSYARGLLKVDSVNKHHFVWENGARHFKLGYEIDNLGQMGHRTSSAGQSGFAAADHLLNTVANNGFTEVLVAAFAYDINSTAFNSHLKDGTYDFGPAGITPWTGSIATPNFAQVNPTYWSNLDVIIDNLYRKGLAAHLYLRAQSNKYAGTQMPSGSSVNEDNYIRYVVARYQAYPNIVFDYQKEANGVSEAAHLSRLNVIRNADGYKARLRTAHDGDKITTANLSNFNYRSDQFHKNGNPYSHAFDTSYVGYETYQSVIYQRDNMKVGGWPVYIAERNYQAGNDNTGYFSTPGNSPDSMLEEAMEVVMAGGYYGYYYELQAWDIIKWDDVPNGIQRFANLAHFIKTTKWYELTPSDGLIAGLGAKKKHLLAKPGSEYLAWVGNGFASISFSIAGVPSGSSLTAKWVNLENGQEFNLPSVGNGTTTFAKPSGFVHAMLHLSSGTSTPANNPPTVSAGSAISQSVSGTGPYSVQMSGSATDTDGPAPLSTAWLQVSGPTGVTFSSNAGNATASVPQTGVYTLRFSATDGAGASSSATVQVTLTSGSTSGGDGLKGEYFNNKTYTLPVAAARIDPQINFNWGTGSPMAGVNPDNFSVRWTGFITAPVTGTYTFFVNSNDGNRLVINNQVLTNRSSDGISEQSGTMTLTAGQRYPISLEYYESLNSSMVVFSWQYTGQVKQVVPQARLSSN